MDKSRNDTSWYTGITGVLSKVGGMGGVTTEQSTKFSRDSMHLPGALQLNPPSTWFMSGASSILQMHPHEGYSPINPFSFHQYNSQQNLTVLSSTHKHPSHQLNCEPTEKSIMPRQPKDGTTMLTRGLTIIHDDVLNISEKSLTNLTHDTSLKFNQPLPVDILARGIRPKSYHTGLSTWPSSL